MMVPFWIPIIIRPLIFRVPPKRDHNFDNHSYRLDFEPFRVRKAQTRIERTTMAEQSPFSALRTMLEMMVTLNPRP